MVKINEMRERAEKLWKSISGMANGAEQNVQKIEQALLSVRNEALEECAMMADKRETNLTTATGNTYFQQAECNIFARNFRALKSPGETP